MNRLYHDLPGDWEWAGPVFAAVVLIALRLWGQS